MLNLFKKEKYTYKGKTQTLKKWSKELGISEEILNHRLKTCSWTVSEAFTLPVKTKG